MLTFTAIGSFLIVFSIFLTKINAENHRESISFSKPLIRYEDIIGKPQTSGIFDGGSLRQEKLSEQIDYDEESPRGASNYVFGYRNTDEWGQYYPDCDGTRQSPIDINSNSITLLKVPSPFTWRRYNTIPSNMTLVNNGHSVQLNAIWKNEDNVPYISGGTLVGDYAFVQLHFHWGSRYGRGSEHTVNNRSFPLEMHLVHYKKEYGSLSEASKYEDGIAVIGILFEVSKLSRLRNIGIRHLQQYFSAVQIPKSQTQVRPFQLSIFNLDFPGEYVSYQGSLTTPPCSEVVTWILPARSRRVNQAQIDIFKRIKLTGGDNHNWRPTKRLRGRMVYYINY